jgi:hypothetical protein
VVTVPLFCYIELAMRQFARSASAPRRSAVWTAVILVSLCFSTGEGLRLTPFPVSQVAGTKDLSSTGEAGSSSFGKPSSLAVPSPIQKRSKRQTSDFAFDSATEDHQSVTFTWSYAPRESRRLRSSRLVPRSAGRAPPLNTI